MSLLFTMHLLHGTCSRPGTLLYDSNFGADWQAYHPLWRPHQNNHLLSKICQSSSSSSAIQTHMLHVLLYTSPHQCTWYRVFPGPSQSSCAM